MIAFYLVRDHGFILKYLYAINKIIKAPSKR